MRIKTFNYKDPLFNHVDATYIIHLEGNSRYGDIKKQLKIYHPTKFVHIVFNEGFKHKPNVHNSKEDIVDVNMYIMKDAVKYNTILVLEDDFMFSPCIHLHTKNIDTFVSTHTNFIYRIGCIPLLQVPYNMYTYVGISVGTHAVLLSKSIRQQIVHPKIDWDVFLNGLYPNYIYHIPLCYQLFSSTDNQQTWGMDHVLFFYLSRVTIFLFKLFQLDKQIEPGYTFAYTISKLIPFLNIALAIRFIH
jgi:hypothetical protein